MNEQNSQAPLMSERVLNRVGALLGIDVGDPMALAAAVTLIAPPDISVADCERLHDAIGLPSALISPIHMWSSSPGAPLPVQLVPLLVRATTLYALAVETFGDERLACEWWARPMTLSVEPGARAPRDWAGDHAAAAELIVRMRKTLNGVM